MSNETVTRVGDADPVEHPAHYELSHPGLECIDLTAGMSFCMGNAVKYVWRYRSKNKPVEDLRKSLWYTHYAEKQERARRFDLPSAWHHRCAAASIPDGTIRIPVLECLTVRRLSEDVPGYRDDDSTGRRKEYRRY
ncbi:DUF3310 domain-containing protein [Bifidobacterium longum]|uniref:DUF3310 domain-containing protein n=1 Tax=Bifidobacterium longum TaxID=216816 RepID=UPI00374E38A6